MADYIMNCFVRSVHIGYQASIAVAAIMFVRFLLGRMRVPRRCICLLWLIPYISLALPVHPQSVFSFFADRPQAAAAAVAQMERPVVYFNPALEGQIAVRPLAEAVSGVEKGGAWLDLSVLSILWLAGFAGFLFYGVCSVVILKKRLRTSVCAGDGIYLADGVSTAFVLGLFRPRIILPSDMPEAVREYVVCHERAHIRRKDHIAKAIAFVLTCLYWYHPFVWVAYFLMNRDIEFACDEKVVREKSISYRQSYATALLSLSVGARRSLTIPLAFSEGSPKKRIQYIISYKKPLFFLGAAGMIVIVLLAVGLLTDPVSEASEGTGENELESMVRVVHDAELENVKIASGTAQMVDGSEMTLELWLTEGRYYDESSEEYLPSIYAYDRNFEGSYEFRVVNGNGDILSRSNLGDLWPENGNTYNFPGEFTLEWADYNDDGCPDFSIGIPYSSSNMGFLLFSVQQDGSLRRLSAAEIMLNSFEKFSVVFPQNKGKPGKPIVGYQYNNATGEVEKIDYYYYENSGLYEEVKIEFIETVP